jgi:hypothetical protein
VVALVDLGGLEGAHGAVDGGVEGGARVLEEAERDERPRQRADGGGAAFAQGGRGGVLGTCVTRQGYLAAGLHP